MSKVSMVEAKNALTRLIHPTGRAFTLFAERDA